MEKMYEKPCISVTERSQCRVEGTVCIKNGSKGARTLGLPLVRRALIPAELCFHANTISHMEEKGKREI